MDKNIYESYIRILEEELLPAMGCTEPVSVAYAAALARDTLGATPDKVNICVSGNILKNVKSVIVPNTGMKGIATAAAAGIIAGDTKKKLEILSTITSDDRQKIAEYVKTAEFSVEQAQSGCIFDISVRVYKCNDSACVRIVGHHTNVVHIERNGQNILDVKYADEETESCSHKDNLTVDRIIEFADTVEIKDVEAVIKRQIEYNKAIAEEGLKNDYGANVGKVLLSAFGDGVHNRAKATAAAGSDARMNGCSLPVVIVSGSGNQGMTASLPVIIYAEHLKKSEEELIRALVVSDLVTVRLKEGIGRLSAYCGAVSAGCGAGSGICYLNGGGIEQVSQTIVNALAIDSGIICDGAKSSCAAKIASAVEAGLLGYEMTMRGDVFCGGDGVLGDCVENTIDNVGDIARNGMRSTDEEIIRLMIKHC